MFCEKLGDKYMPKHKQVFLAYIFEIYMITCAHVKLRTARGQCLVLLAARIYQRLVKIINMDLYLFGVRAGLNLRIRLLFVNQEPKLKMCSGGPNLSMTSVAYLCFLLERFVCFLTRWFALRQAVSMSIKVHALSKTVFLTGNDKDLI